MNVANTFGQIVSFHDKRESFCEIICEFFVNEVMIHPIADGANILSLWPLDVTLS